MNDPEVSVIINSLENYRAQVNILNKIKTAYTYEICVCSPIKTVFPKEYNVRYFEDTGTSVSAINHLVKNSKGKYILLLNGRVLPRHNFFDLVDEMKNMEKQGKMFIITGAGEWRFSNKCFTPKWASDACGLSFQPPIVRWPAFSRETIDKHFNGVFFNSRFIHHTVDNWLATYCSLRGQTIYENPDVYLNLLPHNSIKKFDDHDERLYLELCENYKNNKNYNY